MFWSTQHRESIHLQEKSHGKGLFMQSVAKDMPSFVTFEQDSSKSWVSNQHFVNREQKCPGTEESCLSVTGKEDRY